MPVSENLQAIHIGVLAGEPIRLEGLTMVFEEMPQPNRPKLSPVVGTLAELIANPDVDYLVIDLNSTSGGFELLDNVRRARPGLRQIVIGPKNDDELVLKAVVAGARAYLDRMPAPGRSARPLTLWSADRSGRRAASFPALLTASWVSLSPAL